MEISDCEEELISISSSLPRMKTTLSEQENALGETVMKHLQRLMLRDNESQREKILDLKWFLSHNFLFTQTGFD